MGRGKGGIQSSQIKWRLNYDRLPCYVSVWNACDWKIKAHGEKLWCFERHVKNGERNVPFLQTYFETGMPFRKFTFLSLKRLFFWHRNPIKVCVICLLLQHFIFFGCPLNFDFVQNYIYEKLRKCHRTRGNWKNLRRNKLKLQRPTPALQKQSYNIC